MAIRRQLSTPSRFPAGHQPVRHDGRSCLQQFLPEFFIHAAIPPPPRLERELAVRHDRQAPAWRQRVLT
jgi:hypothetical protein